MTLSGIFAAALMPLKDDGQIDLQMLAQHCKNLIDQGCAGIALFGTTGEGPSFTVAERKQALRYLLENGLKPSLLIVSIGCAAVEDAIDLAKDSLKSNCRNVLMAPPFFYKDISDQGIIASYSRLIEGVNDSALKVYLYHIPQHTGIKLSLEVIRTLKENFPHNIVGVKDSEGNFAYTQSLLKAFPDLDIFVGKEDDIPAAVAQGGKGGISGLANICPQLVCHLYRQSKDASLSDRSQEMKAIIENFKDVPFIPALKEIMSHNTGQSSWLNMRPPMTRLFEKETKELLDFSINHLIS